MGSIAKERYDKEKYPTEQVQRLNRLFEKNESLEIVGNKLFELFGIRNIVLKSIAFSDMAGKEGIQKYEIKAVSDIDFYAVLDEKSINRQKVLG